MRARWIARQRPRCHKGEAVQTQVEAIFAGHDELVGLLAVLFELLHKLCSLTLIFLAGLALRNLFKMKG